MKLLLEDLVSEHTGIDAIYLFGSRAYNTGSNRSDCDLLIRFPPSTNVKSSDMRDFSITRCPALDFFVCTDARATSCSNDSFVRAASFPELVNKLDAILLWTREDSFRDFAFANTGNWVFETAIAASFAMTVLPDAYVGELSWYSKIKEVEAAGLPVRPFIGDTLMKAVAQITDITRKMIFQKSDLGQRGAAKTGWTVDLNSEYDCQNLFFTVVKPWLPGLAREEVAINYDGQKKLSDFSLFENRLIVEMKFIDSDAKKREVVKTLDGLSRFYSRNSNIDCLLIIIYVKSFVSLDAERWEYDFTFYKTRPQVITAVVVVP